MSCAGAPPPPQKREDVQPDEMTFSSLIATTRDGTERSPDRGFAVSACYGSNPCPTNPHRGRNLRVSLEYCLRLPLPNFCDGVLQRLRVTKQGSTPPVHQETSRSHLEAVCVSRPFLTTQDDTFGMRWLICFDLRLPRPAGRPDDERRRPQTEHVLYELSHGGQRASETAQHGPGDFQGDGEGWYPEGRGE